MENKKLDKEKQCAHLNLVHIGQILTPESILKDLFICDVCKKTFIKEKGKILPMTPRYF